MCSTPQLAQYCRRHISPSLTSFVQFLDSAEAVYSTSSASESRNCRHPTSLMSTAQHGLKDCITDRPQLRKPCEGYERTISVATHRRGGRLRRTVVADVTGRFERASTFSTQQSSMQQQT